LCLELRVSSPSQGMDGTLPAKYVQVPKITYLRKQKSTRVGLSNAPRQQTTNSVILTQYAEN